MPSRSAAPRVRLEWLTNKLEDDSFKSQGDKAPDTLRVLYSAADCHVTSVVKILFGTVLGSSFCSGVQSSRVPSFAEVALLSCGPQPVAGSIVTDFKLEHRQFTKRALERQTCG